jgi:hypothetical protein
MNPSILTYSTKVGEGMPLEQKKQGRDDPAFAL